MANWVVTTNKIYHSTEFIEQLFIRPMYVNNSTKHYQIWKKVTTISAYISESSTIN